MKKILITGGAGFIGSHAAEYFHKKGYAVTVYDNLSRANLLKQDSYLNKNWDYLKNNNIGTLVRADIRDMDTLEVAAKDCDVILHTAAQTAVTTSLVNPAEDFSVNCRGSFNIMEAARLNDVGTVIYCSTNKVFGDNVNKVSVNELEKRYAFEEKFKNGIPVDFNIDHCEHTPYGTSKLAGDLYAQDFAQVYGIKTGVFRMSCIYGTRQYGVEDQGWVAWFVIASLLNKSINIFGNGKQVRDVLYVEDLVRAYDLFIEKNTKSDVFNIGGGPNNTLSLLELLETIKKQTGLASNLTYSDWRASDQKVFISDISKVKETLGWEPKVEPEEGVERLIDWVKQNKDSLR